MASLSVVIITFNEERNIQRCLDSVEGLADEIIVVDSYSTDRTREIVERSQVTFIEHTFEGYIEQKNWALAQASHEWVLSLDADESLSEELANQIAMTLDNPIADGYSMNRLTNYCGSWIRHSGWYPDIKLRLFKKDMGKWAGLNPHDKLEMAPGSNIQHLQGDILHYSYYTREDHIRQIEHFSDIGAQSYHEKGRKVNILVLFISPVIRFIRDYFFNLGILAGWEGFTICRLSAYATYLKYKKLNQLNKNQ